MAGKYSVIYKYHIDVECVSPMHIGGGEGVRGEILVHPITNQPFIQSSGLAGTFRAVSEIVNGRKETEKLFGSSNLKEGANAIDHGGAIKMSDGCFKGNPKVELRPRVTIDRETGAAKQGHKYEMKSIGTGSELSFDVYLYGEEHEVSWEKVLSALTDGEFQIGGQKSNGSGFVMFTSLKKAVFDMTSKAGREKWYREDQLSENEYEQIKDTLGTANRSVFSYTIRVVGETEGTLLVKAITVNTRDESEDSSYAVNMKNAKGDFIVPGSSIKGVLRNQAEIIAKKIQKDFVAETVFGKAGNEGELGNPGCVFVQDVVIGETADNEKAPIQHRIHIDKFTQGVISGGLFGEKSVCGELKNFVIRISNGSTNNSLVGKKEDAALALVLLSLRDIAIGQVSIGSGYSNGKGFLNIHTITVKNIDGDVATLNIKENTIDDENNMIGNALKALTEMKERKEYV